MSFYEAEELAAMEFLHVGRNVRISRRASFYGVSRIAIGDFSRIDDFCVISAGSGGIRIGRYVHIAVMCSLIGRESITLEDFSGLSGRVSIYSSSDDFSGAYMAHPTVPEALTNVDSRPVEIGRHCIVGAGSVLLPGTVMEQGAALGALCLAKGRLLEFTVYSGNPARAIKPRKRDLLALEAQIPRDLP